MLVSFLKTKRTKTALLSSILLLVICGYLIDTTTDWQRILVGILGFIGLGIICLYAKMNQEELGLKKVNITKGIYFGLGLSVIIIMTQMIAFTINPEIYQDRRQDQNFSEIVFKLLLFLPLFTVLFEELAFRGILLGLFMRITRIRLAIILSSLLFGIWHVLSATNVQSSEVSVHPFFIVFGIIAVTTMAGIGLAYIRIKSNSLVAPVIIHYALNATGIILAYNAFN